MIWRKRVMTNLNENQRESYFLRLPEVIRRTGYKKSSIYNMVRKGEFPRSVKIGPRAVAWDSNEVEAWIASKKNPPTES